MFKRRRDFGRFVAGVQHMGNKPHWYRDAETVDEAMDWILGRLEQEREWAHADLKDAEGELEQDPDDVLQLGWRKEALDALQELGDVIEQLEQERAALIHQSPLTYLPFRSWVGLRGEFFVEPRENVAWRFSRKLRNPGRRDWPE